MNITTTTVKLADFRDLIQHVERIVNVDWHACVGDKEKSYCKDIIARFGTELLNTNSKRATVEDEDRKAAVLDRAALIITLNQTSGIR